VDEEFECPYCGEPGSIDAEIDESEPGEHLMVQDCEVCCRPWTVRIVVAPDGTVTASVDRS
jgi:transcription elongation factor Elf1